jgi:succinyl-CoA synthetase beta subunit
MLIHEYQAKEILRKYGVPVSPGKPAFSVTEAVEAAKEIGGEGWAVKAQVHAGGRGKGGGIKLAGSIDQVREFASRMLGMKLVTHQTGPEGKIVRRLLVENAANYSKEFYVGMVVDRKLARPVVMASAEGGVDIEEVAARSPEKILKEAVDPAIGLQPYQTRKLAFALSLDKELVRSFCAILCSLHQIFVEKDCSLVEINPLVLTDGGQLQPLDAKISFDDNALYRHPDILALRDIEEEDPIEARAKESGLSYVRLDGNIGCMVNGAGLAMSTLDIIKHFGAMPANFLDVGGGASTEAVTEAFKLILADERVKAVLVNIFGGIMKCDVIGNGIIQAIKEVGIDVPLVVRLEGTNVELGKKILEESGLPLVTATGMTDAAQKVVEASRR